MSQARPNADQARRLFSTSARSRQRWWWKFGGAGVCLGAWHKVAALQPAARGNRREAGSQLRGRP